MPLNLYANPVSIIHREFHDQVVDATFSWSEAGERPTAAAIIPVAPNPDRNGSSRFCLLVNGVAKCTPSPSDVKATWHPLPSDATANSTTVSFDWPDGARYARIAVLVYAASDTNFSMHLKKAVGVAEGDVAGLDTAAVQAAIFKAISAHPLQMNQGFVERSP